MMKKSSTLTAPKGRIPPKRTTTYQLMYHGWAGICLGMRLTRTGGANTSRLYPKYDPMNTSGVLTPNHRTMRVAKVEMGMAPLEPSKSRALFSTRNMANTTPGKRRAVYTVQRIQSSPLKNLNMRAEWKPATEPMQQKSRSCAVSRAPRLAGLKKPSNANSRVEPVMQKSWAPVPISTAKSIFAFPGARNTSACTSFQPDSSLASSRASGSLYCAMSLFNVRTKIIATITVRKTTIMVELVMENQWMFSSGFPRRYTSQRFAHSTSDSSHIMSYVKITSPGWSMFM
mmetsp:Transcript_39507/g.88388  ORF Transcript_39507/g.88388 Transcript_39507/m.88388 type:complete len:286 (+) Transcript_39507:267-1124(+)